MAKCELPEVIVEDVGFFVSYHVFLVIERKDVHDDAFYLFALLRCESVMTIFISACQCINQFSCVEIVVDDFRVGFYGQQATYVLYHLFCVYVQLQHLVGCIQIVAFGSHTGDLPVWFGIIGIV